MTGDLIHLSANNLEVVKRTVAKDLDPTEFDLFVALCKRTGLDPFRRQIIPIIFNAKTPAKRKMETIVTRDGYRCIASRCGNYRPKAKPAEFVYDETAKSDTNPAGIVSVSVELYVQDKQGTWHPVSGEAYWEEYAPVERKWNWGEKKGEKVYTGEATLGGNWAKMPRVMLEKCAESAALRAGWPEEFAGLYGEEEMAKAMMDDRAATEILQDEHAQRREKALNYKGKVPANFGNGIQYIETGKYGDAWLEKIEELEKEDRLQVILTLKDQNNECLREYWGKDPDGALALKAKFEEIEERVQQPQQAAE